VPCVAAVALNQGSGRKEVRTIRVGTSVVGAEEGLDVGNYGVLPDIVGRSSSRAMAESCMAASAPRSTHKVAGKFVVADHRSHNPALLLDDAIDATLDLWSSV
jgi:hypothetical protein